MYLINKFEKDIMENSLQNLQNNKKDVTQKVAPTENETQQTPKDILQDDGKKKSQTSELDINPEANENEILNIQESINTSNNNPENSSLLNNDSISDKTVDSRILQSGFYLSPASLRKIIDTEKRTIKKIKKISRDEKRRKLEPRITRKMAKSNKKQNKE